MQAGKLPHELLSKLLDKVNITDPRVVLGPKLGEDAALIDFGERYLVTKTDPITFATDLLGWYVVQINANDLAVMGATPRWLMVTLLLPEGTRETTVSEIFGQLSEACAAAGVALVGGHTEVTYDLPRPIAVGAMMGEVEKDSVVLTSGARPGDSIILTKGIAIEGTALLAREAADSLVSAGVSLEMVERGKELLFSPGISVTRDAEIASRSAKVHSMHDPTEGGLATGLMEVARAADVGLTVDATTIPVLPECEAFCRALGLDPLGLIGSGALLATVAPEDAARVIDSLEREGIPAREIGRVTSAEEGLKLRTENGVGDLPVFARDELARFLGS